MNYFLIDYENVRVSGFRGIDSLSRKDRVIVFYSEKAETLTFGLHRRLNESKAKISYQKVRTGSKNALDLQLCAYLGYLICQDASAAYYIVSEDQDYAVVSDYWKRQRVKVALIPEIAAVLTHLQEKGLFKRQAMSVEDMEAQLKALLPDKYQSLIPAIAEIIWRCKSRQSVNSELVKAFHEGPDNSVPSEIYKSIKPLLSDKL
ncbi:MAG: hypothetical protein IJK52_01975 [Oscillospiraceae bacterium]|nr:hypothetical protein [Oscillospiraceae bacterium]